MKKLIILSVFLLIAISSYSQNNSGSESNEQAVAMKPSPALTNETEKSVESIVPEIELGQSRAVIATPAPAPADWNTSSKSGSNKNQEVKKTDSKTINNKVIKEENVNTKPGKADKAL
ncbi:MAG: hypothetical protein ACOYN6_00035 [Ignavibacteria bacterium]